jgi:hypothetical protein
MTLKEAIKRAKRIETTIHVGEGYGHHIRVSKKDALLACKNYLEQGSIDDDDTWLNEYDSIIAMAYFENGEIKTLSIGR